MRRLLTPGWLATHAAALLLVLGMLGLAGWQFSRATGGNALSWGYAAQWPAFAGFVVVIWLREVRRTLRGEPDSAGLDSPVSQHSSPPGSVSRPPAGTGDTAGTDDTAGTTPTVATAGGGLSGAVDEDTDDPELAAYNRFLAWLSANPGARPVDYPG